MARPRDTKFIDNLERILAKALGKNRNNLTDREIDQVRAAIVRIRKFYRFKEKTPSAINYGARINRVGYLASFGERQAYLSYRHLKMVERRNAHAIPSPNPKSGELNVTIIGAGAAVEVYGICKYFNEGNRQRLRKLNLNVIEKVRDWQPVRSLILHELIPDKWRRTHVDDVDIIIDITRRASLREILNQYERLIQTDILVIYNVLNEIEHTYSKRVLENLHPILNPTDKPMLVLLAEPSETKAQPRIKYIKQRLVELPHRFLLESAKARFSFDCEPTKIEIGGTGGGLNDRLFTVDRSNHQYNPDLQTKYNRSHMAITLDPRYKLTVEYLNRQFALLAQTKGKTKTIEDQEGFAFLKSTTSTKPTYFSWD